MVAKVRPMVELAALGFGKVQPTGVDLVASNSASRGYIPGAEFDWQSMDLNALPTSLQRGSETVHSSTSGSVMDDQWQALLWLINTVIDLGYQIEPDHYLMTGSIGGIHPGAPGDYTADYGAAGNIGFSISAG